MLHVDADVGVYCTSVAYIGFELKITDNTGNWFLLAFCMAYIWLAKPHSDENKQLYCMFLRACFFVVASQTTLNSVFSSSPVSLEL